NASTSANAAGRQDSPSATRAPTSPTDHHSRDKNKAGPAGRATTRGKPTTPRRRGHATASTAAAHPPAPQPVTPHAPRTPEHTNDTAPAPPPAPTRQASRPAPPDEGGRTSRPGPCTTGSPCCPFLA